jgi:CheY-like chemotaxis protein
MPLKILIVEEDLTILRLLRIMLERHGYEVSFASTGRLALAKAYIEKPDFIIMEIRLSDITGHEVCKQLRADPVTQSIPILILTVSHRNEDKVAALEAGADDYINKPAQAVEILARIKQILAKKALTTAPPHLFISYSSKDKVFVLALREHLSHNGFTIWIDDAIEHGNRWFNEIDQAIKTCAAFLVIMTPEAEQSEWVQKEILLAKRYKKAIFPLLLSGDEFAILIDVQYVDVRNQQMPGIDFHRRVNQAVIDTA